MTLANMRQEAVGDDRGTASVLLGHALGGHGRRALAKGRLDEAAVEGVLEAVACAVAEGDGEMSTQDAAWEAIEEKGPGCNS